MGSGECRSHPQTALLRPGLLHTGDGTVLAAGVADGVPSRGTSQARRLRRVRDSRPVDHRRARRRHWNRSNPRVLQLLPASRHEARRGQRIAPHLRVPVPRMVLGAGRQEHLRAAVRSVRRRQSRCRRSRPRTGAVRTVGRLRMDQPRRRRTTATGLHRAVRFQTRRIQGRGAAHRMVEVVPASGELEVGDRRLHGGLPRTADPPTAAAVVLQTGLLVGEPDHPGEPVLHADARLGHGRDDPRERCADCRRAADHVAARRSGTRRWRPGAAPSTAR